MTAVTNVASAIGFGAIDVAIAGGVEHMGHPMGEGIDPNPRIVAERSSTRARSSWAARPRTSTTDSRPSPRRAPMRMP